jgi:hypothetical protein
MLLLRLHGRVYPWGPPSCMREREGGSIAHVPLLTPAACSTIGAKPGGAEAPSSASVGCWPTLAIFMCACTLSRECSAIWAVTAYCVHIRLLELACMTEIGSAGWVRAARACSRVQAREEQHLL